MDETVVYIGKGYSFTTSVSIRLLPGLGDDIFSISTEEHRQLN